MANLGENGVVVTWNPVNEDTDENPVSPDEVVYDVYRCVDDDSRTLLGRNLVETVFADNLEGVAGDVLLAWQVIAKTDEGESSAYEGFSPRLQIGDGAGLPYVETFNTPDSWGFMPDNYWLAESLEGWSGFSVEKELFIEVGDIYDYLYGKDHDSEHTDAFLAFEPSKWSASDVRYTSGQINLDGAGSPVLAFDYCVFPEAHTSFDVAAIDGAGAETVLATLKPAGEKMEWVNAVIPLDAYKGGNVCIRFRTAYNPDTAPSEGYRAPICIDNVVVSDGPYTGIVSAAYDGSVVKTEYFNVQGMRIAAPERGQLVIKVETMRDGRGRAVKTVF